MELENQVTSLKLSKKLKKLGVKQDSLFYWIKSVSDMKTPQISYVDQCGLCGMKYQKQLICSAFTDAELGERLPVQVWGFNLTIIKVKDGYKVIYQDDKGAYLGTRKKSNCVSLDKSEANARAKMLIYLRENKLFKEVKND